MRICPTLFLFVFSFLSLSAVAKNDCGVLNTPPEKMLHAAFEANKMFGDYLVEVRTTTGLWTRVLKTSGDLENLAPAQLEQWRRQEQTGIDEIFFSRPYIDRGNFFAWFPERSSATITRLRIVPHWGRDQKKDGWTTVFLDLFNSEADRRVEPRNNWPWNPKPTVDFLAKAAKSSIVIRFTYETDTVAENTFLNESEVYSAIEQVKRDLHLSDQDLEIVFKDYSIDSHVGALAWGKAVELSVYPDKTDVPRNIEFFARLVEVLRLNK